MSASRIRGTAQVQTPIRVLDMSAQGARLVVSTPLEVGAIHDFRIDLEGDDVWVQAEIRRCSAFGEDFELGIEFVGIDPRDHQRILRYLERPLS